MMKFRKMVYAKDEASMETAYEKYEVREVAQYHNFRYVRYARRLVFML